MNLKKQQQTFEELKKCLDFVNPVSEIPIKWKVTTWEEFGQAWRQASDPLYFLQLLHEGFRVPVSSMEERARRLIFYLKAAYRWDNVYTFKVEDEEFKDCPFYIEVPGQIESTLHKESNAFVRQVIAKKAAVELANEMRRLTAGGRYTGDVGEYELHVVSLDLCDALTLFFGIDDSQKAFVVPTHIQKLDDRHKTAMHDFYAKFMSSLLLARRRFVRFNLDKKRVSLFFDGHPRLQSEALRILLALGRYDLIVEAARYVLPESLEALREYIMGTLITHETGRPQPINFGDTPTTTTYPTSIDHALSLGSKPALMYKMLVDTVRAQKRAAK